jgi:UDP-glucose 4-epimerase
LTREERARANDLGGYFRVPADNRDLNYNLYYTEGSHEMATMEDYHSHNTRRLSVEETIELLLKLDLIRLDLGLPPLGNAERVF